MDAVLRTVMERRSVRDFTDRTIEQDIMEKLTTALIWAPSAGNMQSRKFYFVEDPEVKKMLAGAALGQKFVATAPLVVVGCADGKIRARYGSRGEDLYAIQDVSCSIMNMMLVAWEQGLGSVWVGAFRENEVAEILELPPDLRPVAIVCVGYPSKVPSAPKRHAPDQVVVFR